MSGAPARGTVPRRQRRHHHHHHHHHHPKHQKHAREQQQCEEPEEKRPKVNPIFLWASQREQRIVEVRCEDYDKRNRIKLTKTAQGWRSIPRTASNIYSTALVGSQEGKTTSTNSASSSEGTNEEKEAPETGRVMLRSLHRAAKKVVANGRTKNVPSKDTKRRKRNYDAIGRDNEESSEYSYSSEDRRSASAVEAGWDAERSRIPCSDDEDAGEDEDEEEHVEDDEDEDEEEEEDNEEEQEERHFEKESSNCRVSNGRSNLERLQKDRLFQPRVVLEPLHVSQLPEGAHQSIRHQRRGKSNETATNERRNGQAATGERVVDSEKRGRANKAGIQDMLNMIDATASPVLATDTPSADLPVDSTKTCELLTENPQRTKGAEGKIRAANALLEQLSSKTTDRSGMKAIASYQTEDTIRNADATMVDDKLEVHEEKILGSCAVVDAEERKPRLEKDVVVVSLKSNAEAMKKSCKVAEADGGLGARPKSRSNAHAKWQSATSDVSLEAEEERPDEPGEPPKMDYSDSSKILNALRNTPGLSISITRTHTPESTMSITVPLPRPASKASSSSRSPDSQAECVERLLKGSVDSASSGGTYGENRVATGSPRNLPGLSIIIPSYRYRNPSSQVTTVLPNSPSTKTHRVESPESTVNFPKAEAYADESKLDGFPHEEDDDDKDIEEDEEDDDCDSQVLEDLRRQKADSLAYEAADGAYFHRQTIGGNQDERKTPMEASKGQGGTTPHWICSSRSSEAQAKCKYQDLEHFDEQVLEELRSRGTVVSPQPSGIPCSPASKRPSSAYLERLLPSPPCSVSCSEDAKNDLTLKGILASPSRLDGRDYDRPKETLTSRCDQPTNDHPASRLEHPKDSDRPTAPRKGSRAFQERLTVTSQEIRNSGRPMSSGDIHSTYFVTDRATPKRPMSAEWSVGRQKSQTGYHQKSSGKLRAYATDQQDLCATSSSTDKPLDPASQLRELIEVSGHLIPDPLLVPRNYLPGLAAAPAAEIPKLLASRPELRLPEALTRPDLLRDPDLLVISLAHLQHVLDHGEGPVSRSRQSHQRASNGTNKGAGHASNGARGVSQARPKLSCKPIGTLMPAPIDLSSSRRASPYPPLLRVRSGLLKQEPEVSSTASSPDDSQLWHPLFGSQKRQQQQQQQPAPPPPPPPPPPQQQQHPHQHQHQHPHASWHRTTLAS